MTEVEIFVIETQDGIATVYDMWSETQDRPKLKPTNNYKMMAADGDYDSVTYTVRFQHFFYFNALRTFD